MSPRRHVMLRIPIRNMRRWSRRMMHLLMNGGKRTRMTWPGGNLLLIRTRRGRLLRGCIRCILGRVVGLRE